MAREGIWPGNYIEASKLRRRRASRKYLAGIYLGDVYLGGPHFTLGGVHLGHMRAPRAISRTRAPEAASH